MRQPHKFRDLPREEIESIWSNYLIDAWSFSKVNTFARNEKAFEMAYVYRNPYKRSASAIAGEAYHEALRLYFTQFQKGIKTDIASLQLEAFSHIDRVEPNKWKVQKTTPSIAECIAKANEIVIALLENFLADISLYESEIAEVLDIEFRGQEFLTVNGVDIPLPCDYVIDLVVRTKDGKLVIIDHKSKTIYTDEQELKFSIGKQAITYVLAYEAGHDESVAEVWFVENKTSKNKDKSPQLRCFKVELDADTRRLYEAMLYEPLKRMLDAISNPDYIYLINENDNFVDKAEIYEFWAQTMMAEVGDFNIPENKAELIGKRLKKIRDTSLAVVDPKTIRKFREGASKFIQYDLTNKNMTKQEKIEHTLRTLGINVAIAHNLQGYSSETFLLEISAGTNISAIFKYRLDIANALNVPNVRINKELSVYEGRAYVSVEAAKVREADLLFDNKYLMGRKIPLGMDNFGQKVIWDMENPSTPHVLIGGSTGSGKSVCLKAIMEYAAAAGVKFILLFDPKREFVSYAKQLGIQVINDIEDIENTLEAQVAEMQSLVKEGETTDTLIIFDEFADALAQSRKGNELNVYDDVVTGHFKNGSPKTERQVIKTLNSLEQNLKMLLQKGRSLGYRIVAATQRASVDVITGAAKVNFPVQICFRVPKAVDSMVMIDEEGAECLTGKGDGLIKSPEYNSLVRFQAFYKP